MELLVLFMTQHTLPIAVTHMLASVSNLKLTAVLHCSCMFSVHSLREPVSTLPVEAPIQPIVLQ